MFHIVIIIHLGESRRIFRDSGLTDGMNLPINFIHRLINNINLSNTRITLLIGFTIGCFRVLVWSVNLRPAGRKLPSLGVYRWIGRLMAISYPSNIIN